MKWPKLVSPFDVVIISNISKNNTESLERSSKIYHELKEDKVDVLLDDVNEHMSAKFKKHDLLGIPYQIIIGSKSEVDKFEFKEVGKTATMLSLNEIKDKLKK